MTAGGLKGALAATLLATLAFCAPASATTPRYASPAATPGSELCTSVAPCPIGYAIDGQTGSNQVAGGDEVILLPGTYDLGTGTLGVNFGITVHGQAGSPRPLITAGGDGVGTLAVDDKDAIVSDVNLEFVGQGGLTDEAAALMMFSGRAERIHATTGGGSFVNACSLSLGSGTNAPSIHDSVCFSSGTNHAAGIHAFGPNLEAELVNVTAVAPYVCAMACTGGHGIWATGNGGTGGTATITGGNVITEGVADGIEVSSNSGTNNTITVDLKNSAFGLSEGIFGGTGNTATAPVAGINGNILVNPVDTPNVFVCTPFPPSSCNTTTADFHELATSPTVNTGDGATLSLGALDLDGKGRENGVVDMGAYEYYAPVLPPTGGGGGGGGAATPPTAIRCPKKKKLKTVKGKRKCVKKKRKK